jgi:rhomboid protease GluP
MKIYRKTIDFDGLTADQVFMLSILSLQDLGWDHYCKDNRNIFARCHLRLFNSGERIYIQLKEEEAVVKCEQSSFRIINANRNETNVEKLVEYISLNRQIYSGQDLQNLYTEWQTEPRTGMTPTERLVMGSGAPPATLILGAVCTLLLFYTVGYALNHHEPVIMSLFHLGANIRLYTLGGEGWRLITSCFLHLSLLHLISNLFVLWCIGRYLEPVIRSYWLVLLFFCTGIFGSLTSVLVAGNRISVGASGAIFGLYGVFIALLTTKLITGEVRKILFQGLVLMTAYGLYGGMSQHIDNAAHVGGLVSGFLFGYILYAGFNSAKGQFIAASVITGITGLSVVFCLSGFHNDSIRYERMLKRIENAEHLALLARTDLLVKSPQQQLSALEDTAGPQWRFFVQTLDSARNFRFGNNKVYALQRDMLIRYGKARLAENEIWLQSLRSGQKMEEAKDSIRLITMDKFDSLRLLHR